MNAITQILSKVKASSPLAYWIAIIHFVLAIGCLLGYFIDDRMLLGANVWLKPLKFCISDGIYILTVSYLLTLYPYSDKKRNIINQIVCWSLVVEIVIILFQAFRGVQSHYNMSSPFDGILFAIMGFFIGINVLIMVLFIFDTYRLKLNTTEPIRWGILMGWIIIFFGSGIGGQMISQMSHNVGGPDGGVGLPLTNWSTAIGDLRVAHFFGLHGIQVVPIFAWWIGKKWNGSTKNQITAVIVFGLCYAAWIAFTFYQAKQGMPLIPA